MATYHAYSNAPRLQAGTVVLITGGSQQVAVRPGDQLSIEAPEYSRTSAVVIDRTGNKLLLGLSDGTSIWLERAHAGDSFGELKLSDGFSREPWTVRRCREVLH